MVINTLNIYLIVGANSPALSLRANIFEPGEELRLVVTAVQVGRSPAREEYGVKVNHPPYGGHCTVDPPSGRY